MRHLIASSVGTYGDWWVWGCGVRTLRGGSYVYGGFAVGLGERRGIWGG